MGNLAIIGGTGFEKLPPEFFGETISVDVANTEVEVMSIADNYIEPRSIYFLSRHGRGHHLAPHQIDYRANIEALVKLGVKKILATNAVGSLRGDLTPGTLLIPHDFIDFTRKRPLTYFVGSEWRHTDFSEPYSPVIRNALLRAAEELDVPVVSRGIYVAVDGPRFETPAEVRMFALLGGDVVGMTGVQEAILSREAGLEYGTVCLVTNYAAGLSLEPIDHEAVSKMMRDHIPTIREMLFQAAHLLC
ncbi:methylthioadenosine phosphorylase [Chthonomonas calidirosea]|uniref:Probable 6-oxopurine nucleoside phosphorylase n=1 Tax=Chthonomonas calidirosea (strain DSM 23976 / ICMP 18418 / T49) TaxID=1303518 RepID=S0EV70_CHTCT|nr:MTAP family purine nucleoside phosphorylase [Chthonomonas calidirosea]CCW34247.1 methylthioadenosine phosphorylase [Chthonomonas calidirosea T49]CEK15329.1 methylthioadenosine phosphorylase [Chthonomonas calidirosea]